MSQDNKNLNNPRFNFGISTGINHSKFRLDNMKFDYGTRPAYGLYGKFRISEKIFIKTSILQSRKNSISNTPYLNLENDYIDFNIAPQFKISNDLYFLVGISYSRLLSSKRIILNGNNSNGIEKIENRGFSSELNIATGIEFRLQENINLDLKYIIPTSKQNIRNFQLTLNILLNQREPKKESYKKIKQRKSKEQILQLKNGTLVVRLKSSETKIEYLRKIGKIKKADKLVKQKKIENKKIIAAFRENFNFCDVVYLFSNESRHIFDQEYNKIFLNDSLIRDSTIKINVNKPIFFAEFNTLEQDTVKFFSHYSIEPDGDWNMKIVNHYYGGPNLGFYALIIKDEDFVQLNRPFPYYSRAIYESLKKHPEQALFLVPLLPFQNWSYDKTIDKLNQSLNKYYERCK